MTTIAWVVALVERSTNVRLRSSDCSPTHICRSGTRRLGFAEVQPAQEARLDIRWQFHSCVVKRMVERDGLGQRVEDHLAIGAVGQVLFKIVAQFGGQLAVDIDVAAL